MDLESVIRGVPEEWNGLTVYPVLMKDYPLFLAAKDCVVSAQQSWPYPWSTVKYLDGLVGMGMLPRLCLMLKLIFRLEDRGGSLPLFPQMKGDRLESLTVRQNERSGAVTPNNFGALRELIAGMNGLKLPDERANGELVETQRDLEQKDALPLKVDLESLIYSVAAAQNMDAKDILGWTVRRFQATEKALDRSRGHLIAAVTLAAGGKFKDGSPYPSWKYDREEQTHAVEPLNALSGRLSGAVEAVRHV